MLLRVCWADIRNYHSSRFKVNGKPPRLRPKTDILSGRMSVGVAIASLLVWVAVPLHQPELGLRALSHPS